MVPTLETEGSQAGKGIRSGLLQAGFSARGERLEHRHLTGAAALAASLGGSGSGLRGARLHPGASLCLAHLAGLARAAPLWFDCSGLARCARLACAASLGLPRSFFHLP